MSNVLNMVSEETFVDQTDDIVNAINTIGGGGEEGFDLLLPSGTVTATDGAFSVLYKGTAPAVHTAKIILVDKPKGIHDDVTFGVSFANGTASFSSNDPNGSMTVAVECIVIIGTYSKKITFLNFPVHYGDYYGDIYERKPTVTLTQSGDDWVGTLDEYPKNVSPAVDFTYDYKILLSNNDEIAVYADCVIKNGTITIRNIPTDPNEYGLYIGVLCDEGYYFNFSWE